MMPGEPPISDPEHEEAAETMRGITDPEEARRAAEAQRSISQRVVDAFDIGVRPPLPAPVHLGDGVFASFDGYHVNLAVNDHRNHAVALDPSVLANLFRYAQQIKAAR